MANRDPQHYARLSAVAPRPQRALLVAVDLGDRDVPLAPEFAEFAALGGEAAPTRCGHAFFGTSKCLFATDAPFDAERGRGLIADTIRGVEQLGLGKEELAKIFADNARALLKL